MDIILIVVGLALILAGANYLTDGSAALAKRFSIPEFVIGLTVVAVGTSTPELVVSAMSAIKGNTDMAIGNIVGSNIFNTLAILGICGIFVPIALTRNNMRRDIPIGILVSAILMLVCFGGVIQRQFGVVMILIYIALMYYSISRGRRSIKAEKAETTDNEEHIKDMPLWLALVMVVGGLAALVFGGDKFLEGAVNTARHFGIPNNVIAITLLAGGTSLPELASSIVSLIKGKADIALGNIIGSNIANILLILGISSAITPLSMGTVNISDIAIVVASSCMIYLAGFTFGKREIGRGESAVLLACYVGYIWWIIA